MGNMAHVNRPSALIFGAGPAGLAAATALTHSGVDFILAEPGKPVWARDRSEPSDLVTGIGGAGPFSDGKFSWYPSASALWKLQDTNALKRSYDWLADVLGDLLEVPLFPTQIESPSDVRDDAVGVTEKRYRSDILNLGTRLDLVSNLADSLAHAPRLGWFVTEIDSDGDALKVLASSGTGEQVIYPKVLIVAGGRFGNCITRLRRVIPHTFRRYEIGIRLESSANSFFLRDNEQLDPKFIWNDNEADIEWRTFCTCRNGEVVATTFQGITTYSGRSDGPSTSYSNVGLNVRIKCEPKPDSQLQGEISAILRGQSKPFRLGLARFLLGEPTGLGNEIDHLLRAGVSRLPLEKSYLETVVIGPTIEGTGHYPILDGDLRVPGQNIWFAGDHTGLFRGLTAAFISGYYVGEKAAGQI